MKRETPRPIRLTPRAIQEATSLQTALSQEDAPSLRLYLEGKGCDGFYYGVGFDQPTYRDLHFPQEGVDVIVDPETIQFVEDSEIDWVDDDRGRGFLVNNPNHRKFRGKFFKRSVWQDRLQPERDADNS